MGGGFGGGGAGGGAGGGGAQCTPGTCANGCCLGNRCVPVTFQSNQTCGLSAQACRPCDPNGGCVNGTCVGGPQPLDGGFPGGVGSPCSADPQCGNSGSMPFCFPEISQGQPTGFVGGYCSGYCDNQPCPPGGTCVQAQTQGGTIVSICLATCDGASGTGCRMGYACDPASICVPP